MPLQKRTAIVYHTCAMSSQERIPHPVSLACVEPWMTPDAKPPQTLQERVLGGLTSVPRTARTIAGNLGLEASSVRNLLVELCRKGECIKNARQSNRAHLYRRADMEDD
tara:strand:- start:301 stop:627 length:327 start_codon:yes stop_codon:yes gene_type:complete